MKFKIPNTKNKILLIDLYNKSDIQILTLIKNFEELPKNVLRNDKYLDYIDPTKIELIFELEEYLSYENLDESELYKYDLTKDFIKYTIQQAKKEVKRINSRIEEKQLEKVTKMMAQSRLTEEVFKLCKKYGKSITKAIESHNKDCKKYGFKTYTLDDYKDLLEKYGFTNNGNL
jgi:uncharacterized HAD superfamily protein